MAVTWTKTQATRTNPFDQTQETVLEISEVKIGGGNALPEYYTFADGTSDNDIQTAIEADLTAKGYTI